MIYLNKYISIKIYIYYKMSNTHFLINRIYKSRKNILEILEINYKIDDYKDFTINEIDIMIINNQLDMLLTSNSEENSNKKVYIKYHTQQSLKENSIDNVVEDLFVLEQVLTKEDTLIFITYEEPSDKIKEKLEYMYSRDGIFIVIHTVDRLQMNILNHVLVPKMTILNKKEEEEVKQKYNIKNKSQFPEIGRFDPQALALCMRPGDIGKFTRASSTALTYINYRVCV